MGSVIGQEELLKIAEADEAFCLWRNTYQNCKPEFEAYANAQSAQIRNFLWGYAESGRLMYQRLMNLACEYDKK